MQWNFTYLWMHVSHLMCTKWLIALHRHMTKWRLFWVPNLQCWSLSFLSIHRFAGDNLIVTEVYNFVSSFQKITNADLKSPLIYLLIDCTNSSVWGANWAIVCTSYHWKGYMIETSCHSQDCCRRTRHKFNFV